MLPLRNRRRPGFLLSRSVILLHLSNIVLKILDIRDVDGIVNLKFVNVVLECKIWNNLSLKYDNASLEGTCPVDDSAQRNKKCADGGKRHRIPLRAKPTPSSPVRAE